MTGIGHQESAESILLQGVAFLFGDAAQTH